jgi:hypothetical protein
MLKFVLNGNGKSVDKLSVTPVAGIGAMQPLHGRYRLGHTKLAPFSVVLTPIAMGVIKASKSSDVLTMTTENGTRLGIVAWGWGLDCQTLLGYLAW